MDKTVNALASKLPRKFQNIAYGTSGFRGLASMMEAVSLRVGMFAALRSLVFGSKSKDKVCPFIGVQVTASHNDEPDNGLKLIDPDGEMLEASWEAEVTKIANAPEDALFECIQSIGMQHGVDFSLKPRVFVSRDTRPSSPHLRDLVVEGARALNAEVTDFGLLCTPQLHWLVGEANLGKKATTDLYYKQLADSLLEFVKGSENPSAQHSLIVDCANGVGFVSLAAFAPLLESFLKLKLLNTNITREEGKGILNDHCGAEHVQKNKALPRSFDAAELAAKGSEIAACAALDGDADRVVFFYVDQKQQFHLLDGDKIIALFAALFTKLLEQAQLQQQISFVVVQTAYANGASTNYLTSLFSRSASPGAVLCTPTGVKHLHRAAKYYKKDTTQQEEAYISVYFESNGHGTALMSATAKQLLQQRAQQQDETGKAASRLLLLFSLINQYIGDAVSDMLLCVAALHELKWSVCDWDALYSDLPSALKKVKVKDRALITTTDAERKCVTPVGLQAEIDAVVNARPASSSASSKPNLRRSFARPSGTEDVVRVFAEAETQEEANELADQVCQLVAKYCN